MSCAQLFLAATVLLLPGAGLLLALGVRDRVTLLGASAPATIGMALLASMLFAVLGIGFHATSFLVTAAVVVGISGATMSRLGRHRPRDEKHRGEHDAQEPGTRELTGAGRRIAEALGWSGGVVAVGLGSWTWWHGMGSWSVPSQEHDPILHSVATAYIHFTGNAAPWQLVPVDLLDQSPISFYPSGFPAMSAMMADLVGSPIAGMNLMTVAALAVAWPMGAAAFTALGVRMAGLGRGWTTLAGGVAALIAAVLYRPGFAFAHDGGILPNAIALVLVPGLLAALLTIERRGWAKAVTVAIAGAGVVCVHPSALVSVALSLAAIWIGTVFTRAGRRQLRGALLPLGLVAVVGALALVPTLLGSVRSGGTVSGWAPDIVAQPLSTAVKRTLTLPYGGFYDLTFTQTQLRLAILTLAGVLVAVLARRGWVVLAPWLLWVVINISFQRSPASGFGSTIGASFYRNATRIAAHTYVFSPALVGLGAALALYGATLLVSRGLARERPRLTVAMLAAVGLALAVFSASTLIGYARTNALTVAQRYSEPQFTRYEPEDEAAIAFLRERVRPGERIMNNANDGSTLAYVEDGLPIINDHSMGLLDYPYTIDLLARFRDYPHDAQIRSLLKRWNITWVYVDSQAPVIGDNSQGRLGTGLYTLAPGLARLTGLPGLTKAFTAGHVSVYHLALDEIGTPVTGSS